MKKKVIAFFKKNPGREFKSKEIAKKLNMSHDHEYSSLKAMLFKFLKKILSIKRQKI